MKLFDQGIQLLLHKSKISVQKELINIFNYFYSLKYQNFFQYLNIQEQRLYFFPVSQTLFGQALSSLICCVRLKFRFWAYQFPSCVTSLNPVPYQRIHLQNFVDKIVNGIARTPCTSSRFCPKYEDLTCFLSGVNRGGGLIFGKRLLSVFLQKS